MENVPMEKKKKKKIVWGIVLIVLLGLIAFGGYKFNQIRHPEEVFKTETSPVPAQKSTATKAPLIPIVRPTEAP